MSDREQTIRWCLEGYRDGAGSTHDRMEMASRALEALRSLTEENERMHLLYEIQPPRKNAVELLKDARRLLLSVTGTPHPEDLSTHWYEAAKAFLVETQVLQPKKEKR